MSFQAAIRRALTAPCNLNLAPFLRPAIAGENKTSRPAWSRLNTKTLTARKENTNRLSQGRAAELLGVTREHLNRVLRGHRQSRRLTRLYAEKFGGAK